MATHTARAGFHAGTYARRGLLFGDTPRVLGCRSEVSGRSTGGQNRAESPDTPFTRLERRTSLRHRAMASLSHVAAHKSTIARGEVTKLQGMRNMACSRLISCLRPSRASKNACAMPAAEAHVVRLESPVLDGHGEPYLVRTLALCLRLRPPRRPPPEPVPSIS
jgi:hypothetical protein